MSTTGTAREIRDHIIETLNMKLGLGTAGLDPHDRGQLVAEFNDEHRVNELRLVGDVVAVEKRYQFAARVFRVTLRLHEDVRLALMLDRPGAPLMQDVPVASRDVHRQAARQEIDSRRSPRPALRRVK